MVVWLTPLKPDGRPAATGHPGPFRLVQKDKMFTPHLLVVPTGTSVEFPNEDPFFHNVFSLFNGQRFDLGLYESGTSRAVRFDREGVSYIFCNIHPEMGAVVLALEYSVLRRLDRHRDSRYSQRLAWHLPLACMERSRGILQSGGRREDCTSRRSTSPSG